MRKIIYFALPSLLLIFGILSAPEKVSAYDFTLSNAVATPILSATYGDYTTSGFVFTYTCPVLENTHYGISESYYKAHFILDGMESVVGTYVDFICYTDFNQGWGAITYSGIDSWLNTKFPSAVKTDGHTFSLEWTLNTDVWNGTNTIYKMSVDLNGGYGGNYPSCSDGIQNQDETGIDVGGVCQTSNRNPVLIIPGVLGTEIFKGSEKLWLDLARNFTDIGDQFMDALQFNMDLAPVDASLITGDVIKKKTTTVGGIEFPLFDYTSALIEKFENQGYAEGADLFLFPYDWRYGVNEDNINKLKQKIADILTQTNAQEVDVIAHSTGGLLVKKYVVENPNNNHIDKAVFVGVPNTGSPKAVKVLLQGDNFGVPWLADEEMKKIAKNLPVVYDLSPSERYFNTKGSYIKIIEERTFSTTPHDLNFEESNNFLTDNHQLNTQALTNAHNLHTADFDNYDLRTAGINLYAINGCKAGTIGKVAQVRHYTLFNDPYSSSYHLEPTPGDGTVPLESSTNLPINQENKYYALKSDHGKMLSQDGIREQIVNIISGSTLSTKDNKGKEIITKNISECKLNGKAISVFSPLDIQITDQEGSHSGLSSDGVSIENNIPNADFEIMGEHKFVYLPNDDGQIYTIKIKGTGKGTFTLKEQNITDNQITQTQVFSNIPVTTSLLGQVNLESTTTLSLDNDGDGITDQNIQPSSVINSDQSQDLLSPISTSTITGTDGQPNFYRSNVSIDISAIDPVVTGQENQTSGILKTVYKLDSDASYTTYTSPVLVSAEGKHALKFFSTDKAGNNETEKSFEFTIDKTAPEFVVQFNPKIKDLKFSGTDNLSNISNISVLDKDYIIIITDQAGNTSQIQLKDKNRKQIQKAEMKSLSYNSTLVDVTNIGFSFDWTFDKQQKLKTLAQHAKSKNGFYIDTAYYDGKTNVTSKDQNGKIIKLINDLVLLKIITKKGDLSWGY